MVHEVHGFAIYVANMLLKTDDINDYNIIKSCILFAIELEKEINICLCCVEQIKQEEEPVHTKCLPNFPLCIRCQINKRSDPSNYCKHCLMYDEGMCRVICIVNYY